MAGLVALWPALASAQVTVIKAGRLVDPETGAAAANQVLVVDGSRISAVGAGLPTPAGARVIDLSDAVVLPGLFDCHTHLCTSLTFHASTQDEMLRQLIGYTSQTTSAYRALQGVANARDVLEGGFTTVRDVGNAGGYADTDLRRAIEAELVVGPTVVNAGRIIAPFGGQFHVSPERPSLGNPEYHYADTPEEIRKAVRENVHFGARVIKLVVDDQPYIYSTEDIRAAVDEAARAGLKVAAHCVTEPGARNAAEARVASIEHGFGMTDEILALAKKNGVVLVGTDFTKAELDMIGLGASYGAVVDRLRRAYKTGITIAFGSDIFMEAPGRTRASLALETARTAAEVGIPPKAVLQWMTGNAARLLGVERERGALKPGLFADVIATRKSPLADVRALDDVVFVMKEGRVVKGGR
jgi:imidazolonepropionase-like amidohydrolase